MDYQCLFDNSISLKPGIASKRHKCSSGLRQRRINQNQYERPRPLSASERYPEGPVRELLFWHLDGTTPLVQDRPFDAARTYQEVSRSPELEDPPEPKEYGSLRVLLSPPRIEALDECGRKMRYNPEAPCPFTDYEFRELVDLLHFHNAFLSTVEQGQVTKFTGPWNITSAYIENYSYRFGWYKISLSYDPKAMTTAVFVHNLEPDQTTFLTQKLLSPSLAPLTLHPMLVPTLVFELMFEMNMEELGRLFASSVAAVHRLGLNNNKLFTHFKDGQLDDELAAENAFGDGQALFSLAERIEFNIMMGKKLLSWFDDFCETTPSNSPHKDSFIEAGRIIYNRLEYLVETLEFQQPRLRRAQAHRELNHAGLTSRQADKGNRFSHQIALDSKADSSAMKAIAVLTMIFLPGTFVAAFFAMPLFNWDADTESAVVKKRFWIYWAVTIPGTVAILVLWRAWWMFSTWHENKNLNHSHDFWHDFGGWIQGLGRRRREGRERDVEVAREREERQVDHGGFRGYGEWYQGEGRGRGQGRDQDDDKSVDVRIGAVRGQVFEREGGLEFPSRPPSPRRPRSSSTSSVRVRGEVGNEPHERKLYPVASVEQVRGNGSERYEIERGGPEDGRRISDEEEIDVRIVKP